MNENPRGDYAEVNGLRMYYEVHSDGDPLVLLHGAYMTANEMGPLLPGLAENRRVIVPEMQGHGRTADVADRLITYEGMADDSPSATRARRAGWYSPLSPTRARACSPSCTRWPRP
jgi:pimeloyl-ACP methyl ester carboxylesterase